MHSLNMGGQVVSLEHPLVMGILNLTPDSFFDGGLYQDESARIERCRIMLDEGADIIDVGAMSTRPGSEEISEKDEINQVIPLIKTLCAEFPGIRISTDTYRTRVAEEAVRAGAMMINDISGGTFDSRMIPFVATAHIPYVLMHIQGKPRDMQIDPHYDNVVTEIMRFFGKQLEALFSQGSTDVILDPGFGFGKTLEHNYTLLRKLSAFCGLGQALLVGISRKSMINKVLGTTPEEALNGTTAAHMLALNEGASILRVHDVKQAREAISIFRAFRGNF